VTMKKGTWHAITLEYQQLGKNAQIAFRWRTPSQIASYQPNTKPQWRDVYLPKGGMWYDFWSGRMTPGGLTISRMAPIDLIPLFIPAGSIIPLGPSLEYVGQRPADTIEVRIYPGKDGRFVLYEDEGDGYGYEAGQRAEIPFVWNDAIRMLTVGRREGEFPGMQRERVFRTVLVGAGHGVGEAWTEKTDAVLKYAGQPISWRFSR